MRKLFLRGIYTESKESLKAESFLSQSEVGEEVTYVECPREKYVPTAADDLPETISRLVMRSIAYLLWKAFSVLAPLFICIYIFFVL